MLKLFEVVEHETLIFMINEDRIVHGRIYQRDGKEIDYLGRMNGSPSSSSTAWIWSVTWNELGMIIFNCIILFK